MRAAAVSAMAQFGALCPDLLENIQVLLSRCQMDSDDEVRDRATYYSSILKQQDRGLYNNFIIEPLQVSIPSLERTLREYIQSKYDHFLFHLSISSLMTNMARCMSRFHVFATRIPFL